ncbi:hypothetical protein [Micromonospora sp. NPDC023888]|uniref:hypothetical protein n=1 Tax=Micromonospora sp. NPDC023888 TaxID=3155607 RepID=UPI0033CA23DE
MERTTLVAFYGDKPRALESTIRGVQERTASLLPGFVARPMPEVHATVIGLETPTRVVGLDEMRRFLDHVGTSLDRADVVAQFGGFLDRDQPLRSRGRRPYERSFVVSGENVVLIGWPVRPNDGVPIPVLDDLRRSYQRFGFRHRYHTTSADTDPDCYLVIGRLPAGDDRPPADTALLAAAEDEIRRFLAASPGTLVPLRSQDISLVRYEEATLVEATSHAYPIGDIDADRIRALLA